MDSEPGVPPGIGTPQDDHPGFAPPTGPPVSAPPEPERVLQGPDPAWAPPHPRTRVAAAPPTGRRPPHPHRARRVMVAAVLVGGLLLVGALSALPVVPSTAPRPGAQPSLVTASPSVAATAASTDTVGGGLGKATAFTAPRGSGTITVTRATWADGGELPPPAGQRYLVLDVTVACSQGEVDLSPVSLLLTSGPAKELPGFGATLDHPLGGSVLAARQQASGQVAYALAPGTATLYLLDEDLHRLAAVEIPAP